MTHKEKTSSEWLAQTNWQGGGKLDRMVPWRSLRLPTQVWPPRRAQKRRRGWPHSRGWILLQFHPCWRDQVHCPRPQQHAEICWLCQGYVRSGSPQVTAGPYYWPVLGPISINMRNILPIYSIIKHIINESVLLPIHFKNSFQEFFSVNSLQMSLIQPPSKIYNFSITHTHMHTHTYIQIHIRKVYIQLLFIKNCLFPYYSLSDSPNKLSSVTCSAHTDF